MLLHPGEPFDFNGQRLTFPDIRCVYWAGGNPFHHHQNLPRLRRALGRVDTIVVHDPYWTAMAKHADIVVPSTTAYERDDFSGSRNDPLLMAMPALTEPYAQSRNDYQTFAALARPARLRRRVHRGPHRAASGSSTSTRSGRPDWISTVPSFAEFWAAGSVELPVEEGLTLLADFRADPHAHRLATPSGRIEIHSATIDGFGYADCGGHPQWYEPTNGWAATARAALIRCTCWPTSRPPGCTASSTAVATSQHRKFKGANPSGCIRDDAAARGLCRRRRRPGVQRPRCVPGRGGDR